jgi:hypothetical protein
MLNPNGSLVLNGISDKELVKILEVKIKHENSLTFNPQQLQTVNSNIAGKPVHTYNNIVLGWTQENGLEAVQEIVRFLLTKDEEKAKAQGQ